MADDVTIRVRLADAARAVADSKRIAAGLKSIGTAGETAGRQASRGLDMYARSVDRSVIGIGHLVRNSRYAVAGVGALAVASVKWGLSFNAQVESARQRFHLFTNDVDGLTKAVSKIDMSSQFDFGGLSDAAAMLGNSGVNAAKIPNILQGIANAAAASGKGAQGLQEITLALSQMSSKKILQGDELLQLTEAGAPGVQGVIQKQFGLTAKQLANIGAQGLSANDAINALTKNWTSGKMAKAASDNLKTLGGQWQLFTGNAQKVMGALTLPLAKSLEKDVLPAASRAANAIQAIFQDKNLAPEEKLRRARAVIGRELGPFADDLKRALDQADIPGHIGDLLGKAGPLVAKEAWKFGKGAVGAFVDAWLHAPLWAKFLTTLYIGAKVKGATGVAGGGKGGLASSLFAKGSSPANPLWVAVVGGKGPNVPGLPGNKKAEEKGAESLGSKILNVGKKAAGAAGVAAAPEVAAGAAATVVLGGLTYALVGSHPGPHATPGWAHGFGAGNPGANSGGMNGPHMPGLIATINTQVNLDGRKVGKGVSRANAQTRARRGGTP